MRVVQASEARFVGEKAHREGGIAFRYLLEGVEGSPANYALMLVDVAQVFATPRHRHNFEQVRIMLEGSFGFGPDKVQSRGSVGYFCEGTYYTQNAQGPSTTLLLQVGGPAGNGYMSARQLDEGIEALKSQGAFAGGVFTSYDARGGKHNKDGYEAVWEHVFGRRLEYPEPRYDAPVLMHPERFGYVKERALPGVAHRALGRFHERGLEIAQLRLEGAARYEVDASARPYLLYCLAGDGRAEGLAYSKGSAVECGRGERAVLSASVASEWFVFGLPTFDT